MPMYMVKERLAQFKANTKAFFKNEDGSINRKSIYAILIAGFVGWLFLTVTFGAKLKRMLRKVPGVNMLFKTTRRVYRTATRRSTGRVVRRKK